MITVIMAMMIVSIIMIKIRTISEYFQDIFEKNEQISFLTKKLRFLIDCLKIQEMPILKLGYFLIFKTE